MNGRNSRSNPIMGHGIQTTRPLSPSEENEPEYRKLISQVNKYNQQLIARDESRKKVGSFQIYLSASNNSSLPSLLQEDLQGPLGQHRQSAIFKILRPLLYIKNFI